MEYNNYYPAQSGHPPPPAGNQHHGGPQMQQPAPPPPGSQMMHTSIPPQNIRQAIPSGPPSHHQQMQQIQQHQTQQQHLGHHPQQMPPQQQHPNYHQIQANHPHGPPGSHSGSPHTQHHNHQPPLAGPPQQSTLPSQHPHHMHPQSPHHHGGPPMHMQQQQQLNQMARSQPQGNTVINHPQQVLQQPPPHLQNFFTSGPIPQSNIHHYPQQNHQHHPHHQPQPHHHHHHHHQQQQQHHHHHQAPPPLMHHIPPLASHHPHHIQQAVGRNSPYYPSISQTEFRVIELNRRLQCRPIPRHPASPLPTDLYNDDSLWWEKFASEFFEDDATLTLSILEEKPVDYTIGRTLIPRFFRTYFDASVTDLSISLRNPKEACMSPQMITLDCDQAFIITNNIFKHHAPNNFTANSGVIVQTEGHLTLDFVSNNFDTLSIRSWKFYIKNVREYIDRSITTMGLPNAFLVEPLARQGVTKSLVSYIRMCRIMEPMQDLMLQYRQTKIDPRSCLRKLLFDRHKFRSGDDNRGAQNKRRKRKPSAAPAISSGTGSNKKSKVNNPLGNNGGPHTIMMSPQGFSLASQDVMVVGEPSMMGGDFGDDNERMITRLENTQYDPTASTPSNAEESDSMNASTGNDNGMGNGDSNIESNMEDHTMSPSLLRQRQEQTQSIMQVTIHPNHADQSSPQRVDMHQQRLQLNIQDSSQDDSISSQVNLIEQPDLQLNPQQQPPSQQQPPAPLMQSQQSIKSEDASQSSEHLPTVEDQTQAISDKIAEEEIIGEDTKHNDISEESKVNSIAESADNSNLMHAVNSVEQLESHTNSIQPLNEESNSNSQLPCSTATTPATAMEQQQPVDNGVA